DSQILMDMNYAHAIINGEIYNDINPQLPNLLQTETYQLVLSKKGEFIELANWDYFKKVLIVNLTQNYESKLIDSNVLKGYYLYYQYQENVEATVIPRVLELFEVFGKSCIIDNAIPLAREMVNPFGGANLQKSISFIAQKESKFPNSVFFSGTVKTTDDDNEC